MGESKWQGCRHHVPTGLGHVLIIIALSFIGDLFTASRTLVYSSRCHEYGKILNRSGGMPNML